MEYDYFAFYQIDTSKIQFVIDYKINFYLTFYFQGKKINERATYFSSISLINLTMMQYRLKIVSKLILVASVKISKKLKGFVTFMIYQKQENRYRLHWFLWLWLRFHVVNVTIQ